MNEFKKKLIIRLNEHYAFNHYKSLMSDLVIFKYFFVKIASFQSVLARTLNMQH